MARPRLDYTPVVVQIGDFSLHPEYDADLIEFFRPIPRRHRVAAVKAALRVGGIQASQQATQDDVDELKTAVGALL